MHCMAKEKRARSGQVCVTLPNSVMAKVKEYAGLWGMKQAQVVRTAVVSFLRQQQEKK
jgi:hypothetical protein